MDENPRFSSKVDWWLGILLVLLPIGALVSAVSSLLRGSWTGILPIGFVALLYLCLLFPLYYELEQHALLIRFGLVRTRILYKDIRRVVPTSNPLSSPALSLDRLHIDAGNPYGPNISPADKPGFLRALAERAPHLRLRGDELVSSS